MRRALLAATLVASGCVPVDLREVVVAPHPLTSGGRSPRPEVAVPNPACVDLTGLRGACTARARVLEANEREVCVSLTIGAGEEPSSVDGQRFDLVSDTGEALGGKERSRDDRVEPLKGYILEYRDIPPSGQIRLERPHTYQWIHTTREVCFPNQGVLTDATGWLELRLMAGRPGDSSFGFRWDFTKKAR